MREPTASNTSVCASKSNSLGLRAHLLKLNSWHVMAFLMHLVLLVAVRDSGGLLHGDDSRGLLVDCEQAERSQPYLVRQAFADANSTVSIFLAAQTQAHVLAAGQKGSSCDALSP